MVQSCRDLFFFMVQTESIPVHYQASRSIYINLFMINEQYRWVYKIIFAILFILQRGVLQSRNVYLMDTTCRYLRPQY